jgi:molybdopterin-guanine dinucleotide biosynthesis protein B
MNLPDHSIPILSIIGKSGSGKTTLLEKLIAELKRRGYRVATVKHHSHPGFEMDQPGKDTWRHAQAGSDHVIIAAPDKIASIRRLARPLTLDEIAAEIREVDIILTEGFKRGGKPALEVARRENGLDLVGVPPQLMAVATDAPLEARLLPEVPQFSLDDAPGIVDWIERTFLNPQASESR